MNKLKIYLQKADKKIVIGAGLLLAAVFVFACYGCRRENRAAAEAARQVWQTAEDIREAYRSKPNYWGLNTASAVKDGLTPRLQIKNGKLYNRLGKEVLIGSGRDGGIVMPGGKDFNIVYTGLNKDECRTAAAFYPEGRQSLGLRGMTIESALTTEFGWGGKNPLPAEPKAAEQACGDDNRLIWNFE